MAILHQNQAPAVFSAFQSLGGAALKGKPSRALQKVDVDSGYKAAELWAEWIRVSGEECLIRSFCGGKGDLKKYLTDLNNKPCIHSLA